mmetsp:Transcript_4031/g.14359  ORF Transcript_4031/g.14359 Transcript_4031/m.14359 type:complete len:203 (-) Transcript_4031:400-1008(-)
MLLHPRALAMATAVDGPPIAAFEAISRDWRGILSTDPTTATKMKWTRSETRMNRRTQLPDATRAPGPADAPRTTKNGSRSARPISKAGLNTAPNPSTPLLTKLASSPVKASREATAAAKTSWRLANSGPSADDADAPQAHATRPRANDAAIPSVVARPRASSPDGSAALLSAGAGDRASDADRATALGDPLLSRGMHIRPQM